MTARRLVAALGLALALGAAACGASSSPSEAFSAGPFETSLIVLEEGEAGNPWPAELHAPTGPGPYPVVVFFHGFLLSASYYREILGTLATHGFVVVAPQLYPPGGLPFGQPSLPEEARRARAMLAWQRTGLAGAAGTGVDTSRLGLAGHSRGGALAWRLALADPGVADAVAGVDPVDGGGPFGGTSVLDGAGALAVPTLVIGAGLESSCAPAGRRHEQFALTMGQPGWYLVAEGKGHTDLLDEALGGCGLACTVCPGGTDRDGMRAFTAGALAAFFATTLAGDEAAAAALTDTESAPIPVRVGRAAR